MNPDRMTAVTIDPIAASAALLLRQRLRSLYITAEKLDYDRPIRFWSYEMFCHHTLATRRQLEAEASTRDGFTVRRGGQYHVLYNERVTNMRRRNFTLAHEVGHVYLNHADDSDANEAQADAFAASLLMPPVLVQELARRWGTVPTVEQLCGVFAVSRRAALIGWQRAAQYRAGAQDAAVLQRYGALIPDNSGPIVD